MNADELRERILASPDPIDWELLRRLRDLPQVHSAESFWFHGWVRVHVVLSEWTWDAQAEPSALIDAWAREHVADFAVNTRFLPPPMTPRRETPHTTHPRAEEAS